MSLERPVSPPTAEAGPSTRLQILSAEHWSLIAGRSLAWNESFSRAGMYLTTLTGSIVALALVAQGTQFGQGFVLFALVILPLVLFIGIVTGLRLGAANYHDAFCIVGMNRIRAGYLEVAPDLERFFVTSPYDDPEGLEQSMGAEPGRSFIVDIASSTPAVVSVLNSAVAAVIAAIVAMQLGADMTVGLVVGLVTALIVFGLQGWYAGRAIAAAARSFRPLFPRPPAS